MVSQVSKIVRRFLALVCVSSIPFTLCAQVAPAVKGAHTDELPPKWDIFMGYSYLAPHGSVSVTTGAGTTRTSYDNVNMGQIFSGSYFFNRYIGAQIETGIHEWGVQKGDAATGTRGNNDGFFTLGGGLILRDPIGRITPFAHVLAGGAMVDGPLHSLYKWGPAVTVGGGLDYETGWWSHRIAIRIFQGDYEYIPTDFAGFGVGVKHERIGLNAARLSAGIVFHPEGTPPTPVILVCSANPTSIYPGEPVTLTADAGNLNPKLNTIYSWSGTGVAGSGATVSVATATLAPGAHTVMCEVKEGKPGKEGLKPWQSAEATASFTVKAFEPPTVSCTASPFSIKAGEGSTVTASAVSPQNRPLTYTYSATAGTVRGNGASAVYSSVGAPTGPVGIACKVSDDQGQMATASTSVTITAPYVAPVPHTQALCTISFTTDKKRPTRVNNEAKACLDEVALDLQKQPDAKVVVVGDSTATEKVLPKHAKKHAKLEDIAAQRAVNTKDYLVTEKGIDAARISVATGVADDQNVQDYLVPSGATFTSDVAGTTAVDETVVKVQERKPLPEVQRKKSKAAKSSDLKFIKPAKK